MPELEVGDWVKLTTNPKHPALIGRYLGPTGLTNGTTDGPWHSVQWVDTDGPFIAVYVLRHEITPLTPEETTLQLLTRPELNGEWNGT